MVSSKIDDLLAGLAARIRNKMGIGPSRDLRANPADPQVQDMIARAVERRALRDSGFDRDLARLCDRLDRAGGRQLLQQVWTSGSVDVGRGNVVQVQHAGGPVAGRDINNMNLRHPGDMHDKPVLVKAGYWTSAILAVAGFGLVGYSVFTAVSANKEVSNAGPGWIVDNTVIVQGGICLFAGLVLAILSSVGASMSRPRR